MRLNDAQLAVLKRMKLVQDDEGWWYRVPPYSIDGECFDTCGPYSTKAEADEDRRGLCVTLERMIRDGTLEACWWQSNGTDLQSRGQRPPAQDQRERQGDSAGWDAGTATRRNGELLGDLLTNG